MSYPYEVQRLSHIVPFSGNKKEPVVKMCTTTAQTLQNKSNQRNQENTNPLLRILVYEYSITACTAMQTKSAWRVSPAQIISIWNYMNPIPLSDNNKE